MSLLENVHSPRDLAALQPAELTTLAGEVREFLVDSTSRGGGHLGSNLGSVELTIALHRVFDSPADVILWDTGHQAYTHKILTGRSAQFSTLRKWGGLTGYPCRNESEHDHIENSHASTALSYADGLSRAFAMTGTGERWVVAVVGDGALTGGMAWEALNNLGATGPRRLIIVVNDNGRSYAPTIGGLSSHLRSLRLDTVDNSPLSGLPKETRVPGAERTEAVESLGRVCSVFECLGLSYLGPVDGHDVGAMENALRSAQDCAGPIVVHALTQKGRGYGPAEEDDVDHFHGVGPFNIATGLGLAPAEPTWTGAFSADMIDIATRNKHIVAVTAAMPGPVGLSEFSLKFPDRVIDVGIAEQHAVASSVGLALGGLHPVVAIYSTFLNRAFDQLLMDAALHRAGVTFVLDRAGVTGEDGPSHHGMWDLSILQIVPGLKIALPRDRERLRRLLSEAIEIDDAPTVLRFPKGKVPPAIPAVYQFGAVDVLHSSAAAMVLLVAFGPMALEALRVAEHLETQGIPSTVVDPLWVKPVSRSLIELAGRHRLVVTIEDACRVGGAGSVLSQALRDCSVRTPTLELGLPAQFLPHGSRDQVLSHAGLDVQSMVRSILKAAAELEIGADPPPAPRRRPAALDLVQLLEESW